VLPKISRTVVVLSLIVQLAMIFFEIEPWQETSASVTAGLIILVVIFLPNISLAGLSYTVEGRSIKSWILFTLAILLVITTLPISIHPFYFVAEVPKNAQAAVIILLLSVYQLAAGGIPGGIAWAIATYVSVDEEHPREVQ